MSAAVHVIEHPLVQHKLTLLRRKSTGTSDSAACSASCRR